MTVVSTKEFNIDQEKYFDLALEEEVFIKRGDYMFLLLNKNVNDTNIYHDESVYEEVLAPDDDFRRALSVEEFRERLMVVLDRVDKKYANKCK